MVFQYEEVPSLLCSVLWTSMLQWVLPRMSQGKIFRFQIDTNTPSIVANVFSPFVLFFFENIVYT